MPFLLSFKHLMLVLLTLPSVTMRMRRGGGCASSITPRTRGRRYRTCLVILLIVGM